MLYRDAGVDIDGADKILDDLKENIESTRNEFVISDSGFFGSAYKIPSGYKNPVLISSIDGIGTKILLALKYNKYSGLGEDIVNHSVNDILTMGAKPLYILDYFASGKLNPDLIGEVVRGMTVACRENEISLIGGETAEMPDLYEKDLFDIAVQITGIVEEDKIIDGKNIKYGDRVFGIPSSGFHTNGYSLIRKIIERENLSLNKTYPGMKEKLGDVLLEPHRSYYRKVFPEMENIKGLIHITGGGFWGNIPRIIPQGLSCCIDVNSWDTPYIFNFIAERGKIPKEEMYRVFNMGIGLIVIAEDFKQGVEIGRIEKGREKVVLDGI